MTSLDVGNESPDIILDEKTRKDIQDQLINDLHSEVCTVLEGVDLSVAGRVIQFTIMHMVGVIPDNERRAKFISLFFDESFKMLSAMMEMEENEKNNDK